MNHKNDALGSPYNPIINRDTLIFVFSPQDSIKASNYEAWIEFKNVINAHSDEPIDWSCWEFKPSESSQRVSDN